MRLGLIGGTGALDLFEILSEASVESPYGKPSTAPARIRIGSNEAFFIARHGRPHRIPPHGINYRANIDVLRRLDVEAVIAINAVGGIDPHLAPGSLVVPDQIIDYTWGRTHTFSNDDFAPLIHAEFAEPFTESLRKALVAAAGRAGVDVIDGGCMGVTQGPRLETAAEVLRLARDGCDLVGMTSMPEASLAREAELEYAGISVVANAAAGLGEGPISMDEIGRVLAAAMTDAVAMLRKLEF